ncbi:sugar ABC transporter substrate-binding protein [Bacillus sp. V3-13]|uniref:sugar ABC transporter substrate-binding protein n=1 Tax=Bacillus sp. V3-13 TaxID=2053728 RepID=UPI000C7564D9|nr:sugar ABC transporter substrate-binding protein [Bacillus sp. V3-13]PLR76702.1 sugar ABC transporter substrate-binding protein [Bacillus sp. V3-13]
MKLVKSGLMFVLLFTILIGCSSGNQSSSANGSNAGNEDDGKKDIAVLLWSRGFEFMVALDQGIQDEAKKLGVNVTVLDGQANSQTQLRQIEDNIAKGVDLIILAPANSDELVPGVKKANDAGIPVVTVDGVVSEGADIVSSIAFNNEEAGKLAAKHVIDVLGKGTVLELTGAPGTYHATLRGGGFNKGMEESPDFKVNTNNAEWSAEKSQSITADSLTATPEINAIFTHNDDMQRGVLSGLRQVGKLKKPGEDGHIMLVGVDGTPEALERIRKGEQDATVNQDPFEMGALAVQTAVNHLDGMEVPKQQLTPPTLITKENVDDPDLWGNKFKSK